MCILKWLQDVASGLIIEPGNGLQSREQPITHFKLSIVKNVAD